MKLSHPISTLFFKISSTGAAGANYGWRKVVLYSVGVSFGVFLSNHHGKTPRNLEVTDCHFLTLQCGKKDRDVLKYYFWNNSRESSFAL